MCRPPKIHVVVLNLDTSEFDCIWRWDLQKEYCIKTRSLGWALSQYDWCPYKKRTFGHRHIQREEHVKRGKRWSSTSQRERHGIDSPSPTSEGNNPASTLISDF